MTGRPRALEPTYLRNCQQRIIYKMYSHNNQTRCSASSDGAVAGRDDLSLLSPYASTDSLESQPLTDIL